MAAMVHLPLLVDKLDKVESELRLHDLRHLPRLQLFERIGKRFHETRRLHRFEFAAADSRRVYRIHAGEDGEFGFARYDAFAHVNKTFAGTTLGGIDSVGELGDMGIDILFGDNREAVLVDIAIVAFHFAGHDGYLADDLVLHGCGIRLLLETAAQKFADMVNRHVVLLFESGNRTRILDKCLYLRLDTLEDIAVVYRHGVDKSLIVEQFLHEQMFESLVFRVAVGRIALRPALLDQLTGELLHVGVRNRRIADHGNHLVQHHETFLRIRSADRRAHEHRYQ